MKNNENWKYVIKPLINLRVAFFPLCFMFASGLAYAHNDLLWTLIYGLLAVGIFIWMSNHD
jgi:hypothetical protein